MNRIDAAFAAARGRRTALIPYVTSAIRRRRDRADHASIGRCGCRHHRLGCLSDPMADGPVIQRASERALAQGVGLQHVPRWSRNFAPAMHRLRWC
jgi:tryptophan synthase alpha chain